MAHAPLVNTAQYYITLPLKMPYKKPLYVRVLQKAVTV